jgi:hypothetical protein
MAEATQREQAEWKARTDQLKEEINGLTEKLGGEKKYKIV